MRGHCAGQTGWDLASGDKSSLAFPATQCRPTQLGITSLDQQQYSIHNPRYMVS